ncbi:retrovirus-related pol polyprotein LINE-1 [Tanacetum coccineum]
MFQSWWLCEEVQSIVAMKQARFRELLSCREGNQEERLRAHERYKEAKKEAKISRSPGERKGRRRRDPGDLCFIKDEEGRTIMDEEEIKKRWGEYFSSLFNARELEGREDVVDPSRLPHFDCYYLRISQAEVRNALQKMERDKAIGPDQIPIEAWRSLGTRERVIERRLRRKTSVSENQFGFMPGRFSVEAIYLIRSLIEKYRERQRDLHMAFLDLEKTYDSVPREFIWKTLVDKGTPKRYIKVIRDMYDGAKARVRTSIENMKFSPVEVGIDN